MRALNLFSAFLLLAGLAGSSAAAVTRLPAVGQSVRQALIAGLSLPLNSGPRLQGLSVRTADPKILAFLERAAEAGLAPEAPLLAALPEPPPAEEAARGQQTLALVKKALEPLSVADVRHMPLGELDGIVRDLFDGHKTAEVLESPDALLLRSARESTAAEVRRLLALKDKGVEVLQVLASKDTKTITEFSGVPRRVVELQDYGRVYRHWVRAAADLEAIRASGRLKAGPVSYVDFTGSSKAYIKDIYPDLRGVFFTEPAHTASEPRVMNEDLGSWVDFRIPAGIKALSLDGSVVMMIPAEPGALIPIEVVASSADPLSPKSL